MTKKHFIGLGDFEKKKKLGEHTINNKQISGPLIKVV